MKKLLYSAFAAAALSAHSAIGQISINFDTDANWTGSGSLTSYNSGHTYVQSGWTFTGGPALRQTTALQDGVAGAFGTYAWRLQDNTAVIWTGTYNGTLTITSFSMQVRRWDASPSPAFNFEYTTNGGTSWTLVSVISNATLGNSSAWSTFSQTIASPVAVAAGQFRIRFDATGTTERIMVDNFAFTAVPEPHEYALGFGLMLVALVAIRRRKAMQA